MRHLACGDGPRHQTPKQPGAFVPTFRFTEISFASLNDFLSLALFSFAKKSWNLAQHPRFALQASEVVDRGMFFNFNRVCPSFTEEICVGIPVQLF